MKQIKLVMMNLILVFLIFNLINFNWDQSHFVRAIESSTTNEVTQESLKKTMKQMSSRMKELSNHIKETEWADKNIKLVQELIEYSQLAKNKLPEDFSELKEPALKEKTQKYQAKIEEVLVMEKSLLKALEEKDSSKAAKIYEDLISLKKKGHKEFRN